MPHKDPQTAKAYNKAYRKAHRNQITKNKRARYAANREVLLDKQQTYIKSHTEQRKATTHRYYLNHKEACAARTKAYRQAHPAEVRKWAIAWSKAHPQVAVIKRQRRQARKRSLPATLSIAEWETILAAFKYRCAYCGKKRSHLTQDHVIPLSKGGGTIKENIVPACTSCNSRKGPNLPSQPVKLVLI